ncbi:hypothetical protein BDQ17DRAFT_1352635, partial [Cyathus striatus]
MSFYPYSNLFVGSSRTIAISGSHIQVLDSTTGQVLYSTATLPEEEKAKLVKAGPIRCTALSSSEKYLATTAEDKILKIWEVEGLRLSSESYDFTYVPLTEKQKRDALSSHENPSSGKLILGHASPLNAFVSAIHIPQSNTSILVSGGGDPILKFWDWLSGEVKHELPRGSWDEDGEDTGESNRTKRKKAKAKARAEAKNKEASQEPGAAAPESENVPQEETEGSKDAVGDEELRKVLAVHQIGSVNTEAGEYLIFSAVGATALFALPFKLDVTPEEIQSFDFGIPVINFTTLVDGSIYVSLDQNYKGATEDDRRSLQVLRLVDGKFQKSDDSKKDLIASLNSSTLLPAIVEELKILDLYGDLSSLPKHNDPDAGEGEDAVSVAEGSSKAEKPQTKRELGRLRKKQAVLAQLQAAQEVHDDSGSKGQDCSDVIMK